MKGKSNKTSPPKARSSPTRGVEYDDHSSYHFSSSAFFNSPDPSLIPIPKFDDECASKAAFVNFDKSTSNKTDALRDFLNIRPKVAVGSI
jgi:hypothetical protein